MRDDQEIKDYIAGQKSEDPFGFVVEAIVPFMTFDGAMGAGFLKKDATRDGWTENRTDEDARKELTEYLEFAWEKALNHRGLSAMWSVVKLRALAWLVGDDALVARIDAAPYEQYGAPKLAVLSEALGLPMPDGEDARRMARGDACRAGCREGCGG